jgi:hypothetical protein
MKYLSKPITGFNNQNSQLFSGRVIPPLPLRKHTSRKQQAFKDNQNSQLNYQKQEKYDRQRQ